VNNKYKNLLDEVNLEHTTKHLRTRNSKVLFVDGLNMFFRCWSTNPTMNEDGEHTGGMVGFLKSLGAVIRQENPTRVVVIFDGKGGSQKRKEVFSNYKADRKVKFRVNRQYADMMSEEDEQVSLRRQLSSLANILGVLPVTTMIYDNIEADDVIGYLAKQVIKEDEGEGALILSSDKDFLQLVSDNIHVWNPLKKQKIDKDKLKELYGVHAENFIWYRVMDGDKSDNIDGVKGCGLKTLLKRLPVLETDARLTVDELMRLAEEQRGEYKVFQTILDSKKIIERNFQIMQLEDPDISGITKLKINDRFTESVEPLDKMKFIGFGMKYKILQNWGDVNDWLRSSFGNLVL
jgi:5'-3' exonuclease